MFLCMHLQPLRAVVAYYCGEKVGDIFARLLHPCQENENAMNTTRPLETLYLESSVSYIGFTHGTWRKIFRTNTGKLGCFTLGIQVETFTAKHVLSSYNSRILLGTYFERLRDFKCLNFPALFVPIYKKSRTLFQKLRQSCVKNFVKYYMTNCCNSTRENRNLNT